MQSKFYGLLVLFSVVSGVLLAGFRVFDFHFSDKPGRPFFRQALAGGDMVVRNPPESWFWSHDIDPGHFDDVVLPGYRPVRLSSYGKGDRRRFAAVLFREPGPARSYVIDLDAAAVEAHPRQNDARPVAIAVDADDSQRRFSLLLEKGSGPLTSLHVDLDEASVHKLLDDRHGIADFVTYLVDGARKYAVILEERSGPSWLFTQITARELDARLAELGATLLRVRAYVEGGQRRFAAVAERSSVGKEAWWYTDIDGDTVARRLDHNKAYPFDLDATRDERGVRYTVVMYRDRE
jgi:hypothetical protein